MKIEIKKHAAYVHTVDGRAVIYVYVDGVSHQVYMPVEELMAHRDDINVAYADYVGRLKRKIKEK